MNYMTCIDNKNYYVFDDPTKFIRFVNDNCYSGNTLLANINRELDNYKMELVSNYEFKDLAIRKNSDLGRYIVKNTLLFKNLDNEISYRDVVNAFNTALIEENPYLAILRDCVTSENYESTNEIKKYLPEEIIKYIKDNRDFFRYIDIKNGTYETKDYLVYEDDSRFHSENLYEMSKYKSNSL